MEEEFNANFGFFLELLEGERIFNFF